jgi:dirigent-like protein
MKKAVALVLVVTTAVAMMTWAGASASSKRTSDNRDVITVRLVASNGYSVDNDPSGNSGGDLFGASGELRRHGEKVGRFSSACTLVPPVGGQCQATLGLSGQGGVQIAGNVRLQGTHSRIAVIGGTGKFRTARGQATLDAVNQQGNIQRVRLVILR